ncbi:MAG: o-succinylbenzoate synthase, partial [SAR324 cluster bacterium]|nr:o-succinylbenzoate synthase [SAR324 cluster bacterium]
RTLKVKVGADDPAEDVARLKAVRQAAGSGMGIRIDANEAWTPDEALRALEALAPFRIEYAEQPVARGNLAAMARLAGASPIPIAADEAALSEAGARRVLEAGAAQVLILKPMALGGPVAAQRVARLAAAHGARVVITTTIDGAIGRAGALHTAAAVLPLTGGAVPACGLATGDLLAEDLLKDSIEPMDGAMRIPRAPGIGLQGADGALAEARS